MGRGGGGGGGVTARKRIKGSLTLSADRLHQYHLFSSLFLSAVRDRKGQIMSLRDVFVPFGCVCF